MLPLPVCVNGGGDGVGGGMDSKVNGSRRHPPPPSPPWSETVAGGTSPGERWG